MRTHTYEVAAGNEVKPEFVGKTISFERSESVQEALGSGHFENENALVASGAAQRLIEQRAAIRKVLGAEVGSKREGEAAVKFGETRTVENMLVEASAAANGIKVGAPRPEGVAKPKTEKGIARAAAQSSGNKLFIACRDDAKKLANAVKLGFVDQVEFDAWLKVNPAPQAQAQA